MKKLILLLHICLLPMCVSCQTEQAFKSVDVAEFEKVIADTSYVLLDVRTATEYAEGHIPGTHFNIDVLQESFESEALRVLRKKRKWPSIVGVGIGVRMLHASFLKKVFKWSNCPRDSRGGKPRENLQK